MDLTITHKGTAKRIICHAAVTSVDNGKSEKITALWDTGATASLLNERIVRKLRLPKISAAQVRHVSGTETFPVYTASIEIQGGMKIGEHRLVAFPSVHAFDLIIGMDIIAMGTFCIENKNGNSVFSFKI